MLFAALRAARADSLRLDGQRTYLRPPEMRDWRAWTQLRATSRDFLAPWEPTWPYDALTRAAFRERLRSGRREWRQGNGYNFFLFRRDDNALVGGIALSNVRRGVTQSSTIGYWTGEPYARQGYMTEGLGLLVEFAFERLGLHRLEAACLPNNAASRALLLKCGFTEEGFARAYLKIDGAWRDHVLFAMLAEDPRPTQQARSEPSLAQA